MKSYRNYIRKRAERKYLIFLLIALAAAVIVFFVFELTGGYDPPAWEPVTSYPMTNTNISWSQTWHPGPWGGAG